MLLYFHLWAALRTFEARNVAEIDGLRPLGWCTRGVTCIDIPYVQIRVGKAFSTVVTASTAFSTKGFKTHRTCHLSYHACTCSTRWRRGWSPSSSSSSPCTGIIHQYRHNNDQQKQNSNFLWIHPLTRPASEFTFKLIGCWVVRCLDLRAVLVRL